MKKKVTREATFCDHCGKEQSYAYECMNCGKACCFECKQKGLMLDLSCGVHFSGGRDGHFCPGCAVNPKPGLSALVAAYQRIQILRKESKAYYEQFQKDTEAAQEVVEKLYAEAGFK